MSVAAAASLTPRQRNLSIAAVITSTVAETEGLPWDVDEKKPTAKHLASPENRQVRFPPHVIGAIRLLLFTGCRLREILHMKWEDIDFERGLLVLPESKTGKRFVVLNGPALDVLNKLERLDTYVIASDKPGKPRSQAAMRPDHAACRARRRASA